MKAAHCNGKATGMLTTQAPACPQPMCADVIQIYTGLIYAGPALVTEAAKAIKAQA